VIDQAEKLRDMVKSRTNAAPKAPVLSSRVISVTSGKGGVGKTNFTINLAIQLSKQSQRVSIIDADFGLANIEVLFGILPRFSFADVLSGKKTMEEVITDGPFNIKFVSGGSGLTELANLTDQQLNRAMGSLELLDSFSDIILIDTGAGISKSVIDFIKASDETIIITTPEPTSLTDAYSLIKAVHEDKTRKFNFKLVVNKSETTKEGMEIYEKLNRASERFLGVKLQNLGCIPYDGQLIKAVKRQEPVSMCYPNSDCVRSITEISSRLLNVESAVEQRGLKTFMKRLINIFNNND
jgi:flagellar biosynthesis protein FlhG